MCMRCHCAVHFVVIIRLRRNNAPNYDDSQRSVVHKHRNIEYITDSLADSVLDERAMRPGFESVFGRSVNREYKNEN